MRAWGPERDGARISKSSKSETGYAKRASEAREADAVVRATFAAMVDRTDQADPRTKAWLSARAEAAIVYARVYAGSLRSFAAGEIGENEVGTGDLLDFLEADPYFFGSGYMKEKALTLLKRRRLTPSLRNRLLGVILDSTQRPQRREFVYYCQAAREIGAEELRVPLLELEKSSDAPQSRKASMLLAALKPGRDWRKTRHFR